MKIDAVTYFGQTIFHPFDKELTKKQKAVALIGTIVIGLTCGLGHLLCYALFHKRIKKIDPQSNSQLEASSQKVSLVSDQILNPNGTGKVTDDKALNSNSGDAPVPQYSPLTADKKLNSEELKRVKTLLGKAQQLSTMPTVGSRDKADTVILTICENKGIPHSTLKKEQNETLFSSMISILNRIEQEKDPGIQNRMLLTLGESLKDDALSAFNQVQQLDQILTVFDKPEFKAKKAAGGQLSTLASILAISTEGMPGTQDKPTSLSQQQNEHLQKSMQTIFAHILSAKGNQQQRLALTLSSCVEGRVIQSMHQIHRMAQTLTLLDREPRLKRVMAAGNTLTAYQSILDLSINGMKKRESQKRLTPQQTQELTTHMRFILDTIAQLPADIQKQELQKLITAVQGDIASIFHKITAFAKSYGFTKPIDNEGDLEDFGPVGAQVAAPAAPKKVAAPVGPQQAVAFSSKKSGNIYQKLQIKRQEDEYNLEPYKTEVDPGGSVHVGFNIYSKDPTAKIAIMIAGNSGLPAGKIGRDAVGNVDESWLSYHTQEEAAWAAAILGTCGKDRAAQYKFHKTTIENQWGFENLNATTTQTIQGIDFTTATEPDAYDLCYVVKGCKVANVNSQSKQAKGKTTIERTLTGDAPYPADFFFAAGPNANRDAGMGPTSTTKRTLNEKAANDHTFFYECMETTLRTTLDAMAENGITHPVLALVSCGLYAPRDPQNPKRAIPGVFKEYKRILQKILDEPVGPKGEKRGQYFTSIILPTLS